jgi:oxygen-independent coproporphyrinogen-3 oxidase
MAPEWKSDYGPSEYISTLQEASNRTEEPLSLYIHIPFCKKLCWFCGCNKVISDNDQKATDYLDHVKTEVEQVRSQLGDREKVTQMHWGGGTPSLLNEENTRRSFEILAEPFHIQDHAEIAMEIDPRTTTIDKIDLLKNLGFNRLSFGVQDLDSNVQDAIHRGQTETETRTLYDHCRNRGFTGINFDLVYGLPRQTIDQFGLTIDKIIHMRPDRIALYSFAHIPTILPAQKLLKSQDIPEPPVKLRLFHMAKNKFLENGYLQIGMDHFVLPDDELARAMSQGKLRRNFMGYTVKAAQDWLGFGMSSISYVNHCFVQNVKPIKEYQSILKENRLPIERGLALTPDDLIRQTVISELMCNFQADLESITRQCRVDGEKYFASEIEDLAPLIDDDLITFDHQKITVTPTGRDFLRNIAMVFDAYLRSGESDGKVFSKTV